MKTGSKSVKPFVLYLRIAFKNAQRNRQVDKQTNTP